MIMDRSLIVGGTISVDYWWTLRGIDDDSEEYNELLSQVHQRAAEHILDGCLRNGGLYIKLGTIVYLIFPIFPYFFYIRHVLDKRTEKKF